MKHWNINTLRIFWDTLCITKPVFLVYNLYSNQPISNINPPLTCFCFARGVLLQDQYKFIYDTLEEFVVCGASHFHVQHLSDTLKQKSIKMKQEKGKKKLNEYESEYAVSYVSAKKGLYVFLAQERTDEYTIKLPNLKHLKNS